MLRTGGPHDADDVRLNRYFNRSGLDRKRAIVGLLPDDYSFDGRRVLDFGCGSGRVLRHFLREAREGEFWGCDLHEPSVDWVTRNLSPPINVHLLDADPRLPHPDAHFDLIYGISVFTHIAHGWSDWLLEMHRLLKPDGHFIATFLGPATWPEVAPRPIDEDRLGIAFLEMHQELSDTSGPNVLHSRWWLREHWGRAFEIDTIKPDGFVKAGAGHGVVVGRKRDLSLTAEELEVAGDDPREEEAARLYSELLGEDPATTRGRRAPTRAIAAGYRRLKGLRPGSGDAVCGRRDRREQRGVPALAGADSPRPRGEGREHAVDAPVVHEPGDRDRGPVSLRAQVLRLPRPLGWAARARGLADRRLVVGEPRDTDSGRAEPNAWPAAVVGSEPVRIPHGEPPIADRAFALVWSEFSRRAIEATGPVIRKPTAPTRFYAEKHLQTWTLDREALPRFRAIALLRDPRDVYLSILAFNEKREGVPPIGQAAGESVEAWRDRFIETQRRRLRWVAEALADGEHGETVVVRYDDLVGNLETEAARLERRLGITLRAKAVLKDRRLRTKHSTSASAEASVGRWRREMRGADASHFGSALGEELAAVGFDA